MKFKIKDIPIKYNLFLSPMASYTDMVFRRIIDEIGYCGLMVTEMVSVEGLIRRGEKTLEMLRNFNSNTPQFVQLFGANPDSFYEASRFIENETDYSGIDINMGCPVNKVVKRGAGSYLMKDLKNALNIVKSVIKAVKLPLTVKLRLGFEEINVIEVIRMSQDEGVDGIGVHFRLRTDNYSIKARWEYAEKIKEIIRVPFFGNGDIFSVKDIDDKLKFVDALLIGRGALINPFIFFEYYNKGKEIDFKTIVRKLFDYMDYYYDDKLKLLKAKSFIKYISYRLRDRKKARAELYSIKSFDELRSRVFEMFENV